MRAHVMPQSLQQRCHRHGVCTLSTTHSTTRVHACVHTLCRSRRGHAGNKLRPAATDAIGASWIARPAIFFPNVVRDTWLPVAIRVRFGCMHRRRHAPERAGLESITHRNLRPDLFDVLGPSLQACTRASEWACARALHSAARLCVRACVVRANLPFMVCLSDQDAGGGGYVSRHIPTTARSVTRVHERVCRNAGIRHHCGEVSAPHPAREIVQDEIMKYACEIREDES